MKVNPAKDKFQINGKIIKKFIFILDTLFANKPNIKISIFYNLQKQKAILDFLLNKFQSRFFLISIINLLCRVLLYFKNDCGIYRKGGYPEFHYIKKYIVKINSLNDYKILIKCRNQIRLDNKLIYPYSITTFKQKIEYMIFKVIFNERRNRQFRRELNLLGHKVLDFNIVCFGIIILEFFKEGDLKLFNKFVFKDLVL